MTWRQSLFQSLPIVRAARASDVQEISSLAMTRGYLCSAFIPQELSLEVLEYVPESSVKGVLCWLIFTVYEVLPALWIPNAPTRIVKPGISYQTTVPWDKSLLNILNNDLIKMQIPKIVMHVYSMIFFLYIS